MPIALRRSYVDRRIFIALSVIALFSLSTTIVTIVAISQMLDARQVGLTYSNARTTLEDLITQLNASESAQRGYILTGDVTYLAPYDQARDLIPGDLTNLRQAVAGTRYESNVAALEPTINAKLTELANSLTAYANGGQAASLQIVTTGQGQTLMNDLRQATTTIATDLDNQVSVTRSSVDHYAGLARDVGLLALGGTLFLVVGVYFLFDHAVEAERALDRAKDEFVALASHQLRTPASGIKSILSMLEQGDFGPLSDRQLDAVSKAALSNERELAIIEELLNVAKADAGRLTLRPAELDLSALVSQIIGEQRAALNAKQLELKFKCPSHPVTITADKDKLYMAISNLLDNARKYTPNAGRITITLAPHHTQVVVEVADTGIGIEDHELDHIFDRFQRARMVLAGTIEGTGLGLYLARRIAELHHGTINVDSKKGHGSRFVMVLPRRTPA